MSQAENNNIEAPASPLIFSTPGETLSHCANLIRFLGSAVSAIQHGGGNVNQADADTVCMLADMAANAIEWEGGRMASAGVSS